MITKLDNKDIEMLESSVKNSVSKGALEEYLNARNKAETAWKVFRDSLVLSESLVEEENNKKKHKLKAGDKVRVLNTENALDTAGFEIGDVAEVIEYTDLIGGGVVELKTPKRTKRACFMESALEPVKEKTPNELRAEIIQRAKEFVEEKDGYGLIWLKLDGKPRCVVDINFVVNDKKRTVVALLKDFLTREVNSKGIAKCNPDDVFNADIGKAIALGRALGEDVSEFENAVQPTKVVQGQVIVWKQEEEKTLYRIDDKTGNQFNFTEVKSNEKHHNYEYREIEKHTNIVDDTNAQYE